MSLNFETVSLGEHLYIKGRIGWKGLKKDEYLDQGDYRIINATALEEEGINWDDCGYISKERFEESPEIILKYKDILISKDGTIGKLGYVKNLEMDSTVASGIFVVRNQKEDYIDTDFLYYYFKSPFFKWFIKSVTEGSVIPHLYQRDFTDMEFNLFNLDTQKKCSYILNSIEEKINVNRKINKNLEKTLITIFNSWFINFENYDNSKGMKIDESYGEIPVDWSVEMLEDYVDFVTGVEPGSKNYHEKPEPHDIPFLRVGDLGSRDNGVFIDPSLSKNKILKYDDIVLSLDATIGIVKMGLEGAYSTGMRKLVIKNDNINQPFLYCLVKSNRIQRIIETFATGTTILHAGKSIKHMNFVLSDKKTMDDFGKIGNPIISIILTNLKEIEYLTNLRDTLLPKLMSGEIDVSKINCDLELKYNYMKYLFNQIHTPMSKSVV